MSLEKIDDILPSSIDNTNFRYLVLENLYCISLIVINYPRFTNFLDITEGFPKDLSYTMAFYIKKQDTMKLLKQLTQCISSSSAEIKTSNKNQIDIDILDKVKNDAINLRKQIQINNEEIFFVSCIITFSSSSKEKLYEILNFFQSKIYSKGLTSNITNFRHLDSYLLTLPLNKNKEKLLELNYRNFTTSALLQSFFFYTKTIFDKEGVLFGILQDGNRICNIDIFSKKYLNSNMCIFGSSGSGKSFFSKLLILRHFLSGKIQYVFDLEGEYINIAKNLNMFYIEVTSKNPSKYFNIFEIFDYEIKNFKEHVINYKISKVTKFITTIAGIEDKEYIKSKVKMLYKSFNIDTLESLKRKSSNEKIFFEFVIIPKEKFPTMFDFLKIIEKERIKELIIANILKKYPCFCNITDESYNEPLKIISTKGLSDKSLCFFTDYFLSEIELILEKDLKDNKKSIIYIDELWRYINTKISYDFSRKIFELFKTIRKKSASIIAITQDISDFFLFEKGAYGKTIMNNCAFKVFFKFEYSDFEVLDRLSIVTKKTIEKISRLSRGQANFIFDSNEAVINIDVNKYEMKILEEEE